MRVWQAWWFQTLVLVLAVIIVMTIVTTTVAPELGALVPVLALGVTTVAGSLLRARERRVHPELDDPKRRWPPSPSGPRAS